MLGRASFVAIALVSAGIGAHSLNPRELYNEMYPVETLKRDAFHICNDADPTFVRAVKVDREACYDSMPHAIELALGRIHASGALTMANSRPAKPRAKTNFDQLHSPVLCSLRMPEMMTMPCRMMTRIQAMFVDLRKKRLI